jgi:hypothetical protein
MQVLFRKTLNLFVSYPVLWLPFVVAELLTNVLHQLRHLTLRPLLNWFSARHTVFGGESQHLDQAAEAKTRVVEFLLQEGTSYLQAFLTAVALVLTAVLVYMILRGQTSGFAAALSALRDYPRRMGVYALKFWVLGLLFFALIGFPVISLVSAFTNSSPTVWNIVAKSESLLTLPVIAWIMAPIALALVRPADSAPPSSMQKQQARYFWIAVGFIGLLMAWLIDPPLIKLTARLSWQPVLSSLRSLLVESHSVLLYIGLALIAAEEPLPDFPPLGSRIKTFLEPLMPLHFRSCADGEPKSCADGERESCADGEPKSSADGEPKSCADGEPKSCADGS